MSATFIRAHSWSEISRKSQTPGFCAASHSVPFGALETKGSADLPCEPGTFVGTYVGADSVTGTLTVYSQAVAFGLKKQ